MLVKVPRPKINIPPDPVDTTLPLHLENLYITQESQRLDRSVPLVQGRDGMLRVFVLANAPVAPAPTVRARIQDASGKVLLEQDVAGPPGGVPRRIDEAVLDNAWNLPIPGSLIQPGITVTASVIDPPHGVPTGILDFPADGKPLPLDVVPTPPLDLVLIPIRTPRGVGQIVGPGRTLESWAGLLKRCYPMGQVNLSVGNEFRTDLDPADDDQQTRLMRDLEAKRLATGRHDRQYFYGVFPAGGRLPGRGLTPKYLTSADRTAVGWDYRSPDYPRAGYAETLVHELGHNLGLEHADCGEHGVYPDNIDPENPYKGGEIGACGFDLADGRPVPPTHKDVMTYCSDQWSSDYDCRFILAFRAGDLPSGPGRSEAPAEDCLLVQGTIGHGRAALDPAFPVHRPPLPPGPGDYQLAAVDRAGKVLASESFEPAAVGPEGASAGLQAFTLVLPLDQAGQRSLAALQVSREGELLGERRAARPAHAPGAHAVHQRGGRARLTWDAKDYPEAVVKDPRSGEVVAVGESGKLDVAAPGRDLDVLFSDGLHTVEQDVKVK
jgi:hypothetical protein